MDDYLIQRKKYRSERRLLDKQNEIIVKQIEHYQNEAERMYYTIENSEQILRELERDFKDEIQLKGKDFSFLFFATALQCVRWMFQPRINPNFEQISRSERHDSGTDGRAEFKQGRQKATESQNAVYSRKFPDIPHIFLYPVPYDVMAGTERIIIPGVSNAGVRLSPDKHHAATLGHVPIVGYVYGPLNILTRTVTFNNPMLQTCEVHLTRDSYLQPNKYHGQYVTKDVSQIQLFKDVKETLSEDIKRYPAAILRYRMHIESDKFCKDGLPIPFISADKAQALMEKGWNSNELERYVKFLAKNAATIGVQALIAELINLLIDVLYSLTYSNEKDSSKELMEVRKKKILTYSNMIASTSNVIYSAISQDISKLDIGGLLLTIYRIATDSKFIKQVHDEYVYGGFEKQLTMREFHI